MTTVGHVHGRFQPFHREHLDYARWAAANCDRLVVGITNADPSHVAREAADPKRHEERHNPFRYHERHRMIRAAVADASLGVPVDVMPFPINRPALWEDYAPSGVTHFVNVLEEWHEVKAERLRAHGRAVVTKEGTRTVSGEGIRRAMAHGGAWEADLPPGVSRIVRAVDGVERVRDLWEPS
jgi:nicotinamide-nucleotide adenylyltransferase